MTLQHRITEVCPNPSVIYNRQGPAFNAFPSWFMFNAIYWIYRISYRTIIIRLIRGGSWISQTGHQPKHGEPVYYFRTLFLNTAWNLKNDWTAGARPWCPFDLRLMWINPKSELTWQRECDSSNYRVAAPVDEAREPHIGRRSSFGAVNHYSLKTTQHKR